MAGEARLPTRQRPPKASLGGRWCIRLLLGSGSGQQLLQQHGPPGLFLLAPMAPFPTQRS